MLSKQLEQRDRRETLLNDQRQRGSTFLDHTTNDTGGRFTQVGAAHVVGSTATPQYPQASPPFQRDVVPDEPPLSAYENPGFEASMSVEASGPADAPSSSASPLVSEDAEPFYRRLK